MDTKRSEAMRARWAHRRKAEEDIGDDGLDALDLAAMIDDDVRSDEDDVRDVVAGRMRALDPRRL